MRAMADGDQFFFAHSSCAVPGIGGIAEIIGSAYEDPTQFDRESHYFDPKSDPAKQRWTSRDVRFVERFPSVLPLQELRAHTEALGPFHWEGDTALQYRRDLVRFFNANLKDGAPALAVPILVMASGDDRLVDPAAIRAWAERAPRALTTCVEWPGLFHEMFNEVGRERVLARVAEWLDARVG